MQSIIWPTIYQVSSLQFAVNKQTGITIEFWKFSSVKLTDLFQKAYTLAYYTQKYNFIWKLRMK